MYKVETFENAKKRLHEMINNKLQFHNDKNINISTYWNKNRTKVFAKVYVFGTLHKTIQGYIKDNNNVVVITEKYN